MESISDVPPTTTVTSASGGDDESNGEHKRSLIPAHGGRHLSTFAMLQGTNARTFLEDQCIPFWLN